MECESPLSLEILIPVYFNVLVIVRRSAAARCFSIWIADFKAGVMQAIDIIDDTAHETLKKLFLNMN